MALLHKSKPVWKTAEDTIWGGDEEMLASESTAPLPAAPGPSDVTLEWTAVGRARDLPARTQVEVCGRHVTVFRVARGGVNEWYAIDSICYHAGGALGSGGRMLVRDGTVCVECPVHMFRVDVASGRLKGIREGRGKRRRRADGDEGLGDHGDVRKDPNADIGNIVQRVHETRVVDGIVEVRIRTDTPPQVPSDTYAYRRSFFRGAVDW